MKIIGITGPTGSGKGVCCDYLRSLGIPCIDTDQVYHDLLLPPSPCAEELAFRFGKDILREDQTVDRAKLASIVFSDKTGKASEDLNRIAHKYVKEKTLALLDEFRNQNHGVAVVDAPLLFEADFDRFCDFTISVLAKRETRLDRIMKRDALSREKAQARISAQNEDIFYTSRSNYVLQNDGDRQALYPILSEILSKENVSTGTLI